MGVLQGTVPGRGAAPRRRARGLLGEEDPEHGAGCLATGDRSEDGPRVGTVGEGGEGVCSPGTVWPGDPVYSPENARAHRGSVSSVCPICLLYSEGRSPGVAAELSLWQDCVRRDRALPVATVHGLGPGGTGQPAAWLCLGMQDPMRACTWNRGSGCRRTHGSRGFEALSGDQSQVPSVGPSTGPAGRAGNELCVSLCWLQGEPDPGGETPGAQSPPHGRS